MPISQICVRKAKWTDSSPSSKYGIYCLFCSGMIFHENHAAVAAVPGVRDMVVVVRQQLTGFPSIVQSDRSSGWRVRLEWRWHPAQSKTFLIA